MDVMVGDDLVIYRLGNLFAAMPKVDDNGAATGIDIAVAPTVFYPHPLGLGGCRHGNVQSPVKHIAFSVIHERFAPVWRYFTRSGHDDD
jgi:hypothetical protein